jgi:hypothetical protein
VVESIERVIRARSRARAWNAPKAVIQPPDGRYGSQSSGCVVGT